MKKDLKRGLFSYLMTRVFEKIYIFVYDVLSVDFLAYINGGIVHVQDANVS